MDLTHRDSSGGFFFCAVHLPKKKPAIDTDAGFPVFSHPQLLGLDFETMMHLKQCRVYVQRSIPWLKKTRRARPRRV
jgi:hypothetical protein